MDRVTTCCWRAKRSNSALFTSRGSRSLVAWPHISRARSRQPTGVMRPFKIDGQCIEVVDGALMPRCSATHWACAKAARGYQADGIRVIVDAADRRCRSASTIISISCLKST